MSEYKYRSRADGKKYRTLHIRERGCDDVDVEVRITPKDKFLARLNGKSFEADTFAALSEQLRAEVRSTRELEFERVIAYRFRVQHRWGSRRATPRRRTSATVPPLVTMRGGREDEPTGFSFEFDVLDVAKTNDGWRVYADVHESDGALVRSQVCGRGNHGKGEEISFTEARYRQLVALRAGIVDFVAKLEAVLGAEPDAFAALLAKSGGVDRLLGGKK